MEAGRAGARYAFTTTLWSVVLSAAKGGTPQSRDAWEKLAAMYWFPLYAFIRRTGRQPEDAQDLTQDFLARLMEKDALAGLAAGEGRFRSFLLVCLKRYLTDQHRYASAARRRPAAGWLPLDEISAESRYQSDLAHTATPEQLFGREYAAVILDRALARLEAYYAERGRQRLVECLLAHVLQDPTALPHRELADQLGISESAVKSEMYRLRQRFRLLFREEVAATVPAGEVEEEMRHLVLALSQ